MRYATVIMARAVDNLSTFLNEVRQQPMRSVTEAAPQSASAGNAAQQVLRKVLAFPGGLDLGLLYKDTGLPFDVFASAVERLKKLDGIRVETGPNGEIAFPGPNSDAVESLIS
jgi:hypothetical protein